MPLIAVVPVVSIGAILVLILGISSVPFKSFQHRYLLSRGTFLTNHDVTTVERKTAEFWLVLVGMKTINIERKCTNGDSLFQCLHIFAESLLAF